MAWEDLCNEIRALGNYLAVDESKQRCYYRTIEAGVNLYLANQIKKTYFFFKEGLGLCFLQPNLSS